MTATWYSLVYGLGTVLFVFMQAGQMARADDLGASAFMELEEYAVSFLQQDIERIVDYWHPDVLAAVGGREAAVQTLSSALSQWFEAGVFPDRIDLGQSFTYQYAQRAVVLVKALRIARGFPRDIVVPQVYALSTADSGRNWRVVDNNCLDDAWIGKIFGELPEGELSRIRNQRFSFKSSVSADGAETASP